MKLRTTLVTLGVTLAATTAAVPAAQATPNNGLGKAAAAGALQAGYYCTGSQHAYDQYMGDAREYANDGRVQASQDSRLAAERERFDAHQAGCDWAA
jgi:hypothetical protein